MERASDVNNVADRTETPSSRQKLKKPTYESYVKGRAAYRSAINESPEICTIVHKEYSQTSQDKIST
jgi:hypothetical protein